MLRQSAARQVRRVHVSSSRRTSNGMVCRCYRGGLVQKRCDESVALIASGLPATKWKICNTNCLVRSFATIQRRSFESEKVEDDLEQTTRDARSIPLGTMDKHQVDHVLDVIQAWLSQSERDVNEVLQADLLLHRLTAEHATNTMIIQRYTDNLVQTQTQVLQAWLSFGPNVMALEHADGILFRLVDWYVLGRLPKDLVLARDFVALSDLWLETNTTEATAHVVDLLLWWTHDPVADFCSPQQAIITPLFQTTLKRLLIASETDHDVLRSLLNRMEALRNECGWQDVMPSHPFIQNKAVMADDVNNLISETATNDNDHATLSSFELATMKEQFLQVLKTETKENANKVEEFVKRWNSYIQSNGETTEDDGAHKDVYHALLDYYVRIDDPQKATQQLKKLDQQTASDGTNVLSLEKWNSVLGLWSNNENPAAPWRAQELVQRMEELAKLGMLQVDATAYNLLSETWLKSGEADAGQKVLDIVRRMIRNCQEAPDVSTFKLILRVLDDQETTDFAEIVDVVLMVMEEKWNGVDEFGELQSLLEKIMHTVSEKRMSQQAETLLLDAINCGIPLSPSFCENSVKSHMKYPRKAAVTIAMLEEAERNSQNVTLSFACFEHAIASFLNSRIKGAFAVEKALMSRLLDRMVQGDLSIPPQSEVDRFFAWVLFTMRGQGRAYNALETLEDMEIKLMEEESSSKHKIPVDCFNHVLFALGKVQEVDEVEEVFNRLLKYYRSGHDHLIPNAATIGICLNVLAEQGKTRGTTKKVERFLDEMIAFYQRTGREECKPDDGNFNTVLIALKESPSRHSVDRSLALLEQMVKLGVKPQTFTFNTVMTTLLRNRPQDSFRMVVHLMDKIEKMRLEPNTVTYNILLNACAGAKDADRESALSKAVEAMGQVRQHGVDKATYSTFVKALDWLLPRGDNRRDALVASAFRLCCKDGFLSPEMEQRFRMILSATAWKKLYKDKLLKEDMVPPEWTRNV